MSVLADREAAEGVNETYQFVVDDSAFHVIVRDGDIQIRDGRAADPAATWTTDEQTWSGIAMGRLSIPAAVASGSMTVAGDAEASRRMRRIFSRTQMLARAEATARQLPAERAPEPGRVPE
jgi:putative sterol carrier protein